MSKPEQSRDDRRLIELERGLDRWGGNLADWPLEARREADALLAESTAARRLVEAARRVDGALSALMQSDIAFASAPRRAPQPTIRWVARWGMAAIAASLLVGFVAGSLLPAAEEDDGGRIFIAVQDGDDAGGVL